MRVTWKFNIEKNSVASTKSPFPATVLVYQKVKPIRLVGLVTLFETFEKALSVNTITCLKIYFKVNRWFVCAVIWNSRCLVLWQIFNPSCPNPGRREKINFNFYFRDLCGASKGFMKALNAFIKPFKAPQRIMKIKIEVNSYFNLNL